MNYEVIAWLFTNVQSGDIEAACDPDHKQDEPEYWHREPLYTHKQLEQTLAQLVYHQQRCADLQEDYNCLALQHTLLDKKLAQLEHRDN